jgi:hypothetical protein
MVGAIVLVTVLALTFLATIAGWRMTRRLLTVGDMKNFSVSRQWLLEHQSDDRS